MTKINTVGGYHEENFLAKDRVIGGNTAVEIISPNLDNLDGIGFQIVYEDYTRDLEIEDTDNVDVSSQTWVFANGSFNALRDEGGTFTVTGSANGNDGTYTIDTVTNGTTIISVEAPGGSDETFDPDAVAVSVTDPPVQAEVDCSVSNDYTRSITANLNQVPTAGHWTDFTAAFSPPPSSITAAGSQFIQAYPLVARHVKLTITPSAGASLFQVIISAKGNR